MAKGGGKKGADNANGVRAGGAGDKDLNNLYTASALLSNYFINSVNSVMEIAAGLNTYHKALNDYALNKLKPPSNVDLSVFTMAIGLTYSIQLISFLFAPICPRPLIIFLGKYQETLNQVLRYLQSGNVNESNTKKYLEMLLDRYHELSQIASDCLELPVELGVVW